MQKCQLDPVGLNKVEAWQILRDRLKHIGSQGLNVIPGSQRIENSAPLEGIAALAAKWLGSLLVFGPASERS